MGWKKYYCDFCCRSFNDDKNVRSKHLKSVAHVRARDDHYAAFKDPETVLKENAGKKPCRRFQGPDGFCPFGSSCTYSHYTSRELDLVRQMVARLATERNRSSVPPPEVFVQMCEEMRRKRWASRSPTTVSHALPRSAATALETLPPSMRPFQLTVYDDVEMTDWG